MHKAAIAALACLLSAGAAAAQDAGGEAMHRSDYIELKAKDLAESRAFYSSAFGFAFTDFGPEYSATIKGDHDIGLRSDGEAAPPLPAIQSWNLEESHAAVKAAGGTIVEEIFAFPGGRRFEFTDPSGNRLAVYQADEPGEE